VQNFTLGHGKHEQEREEEEPSRHAPQLAPPPSCTHRSITRREAGSKMAAVLESSSSGVLVVYQSVSDLCSSLRSSEILELVLFYFCGPFPPQFLG
jgi:hypothetical protein